MVKNDSGSLIRRASYWNFQLNRYVWKFLAHAISAVLSKFRCYWSFREIPLNFGNSFMGSSWVSQGLLCPNLLHLLLCYFHILRYKASKRGEFFVWRKLAWLVDYNNGNYIESGFMNCARWCGGHPGGGVYSNFAFSFVCGQSEIPYTMSADNICNQINYL